MCIAHASVDSEDQLASIPMALPLSDCLSIDTKLKASGDEHPPKCPSGISGKFQALAGGIQSLLGIPNLEDLGCGLIFVAFTLHALKQWQELGVDGDRELGSGFLADDDDLRGFEVDVGPAKSCTLGLPQAGKSHELDQICALMAGVGEKNIPDACNNGLELAPGGDGALDDGSGSLVLDTFQGRNRDDGIGYGEAKEVAADGDHFVAGVGAAAFKLGEKSDDVALLDFRELFGGRKLIPELIKVVDLVLAGGFPEGHDRLVLLDDGPEGLLCGCDLGMLELVSQIAEKALCLRKRGAWVGA